MQPADDDVTASRVMTVARELATPEFKLDRDSLESAIGTTQLGGAVGKTILDAFHHETEFLGKHPEEEHDAQFVDRSVA